MHTRTSLGPANRCVRSRGSPARQDESDRKAAKRGARTFATKRAARAAVEVRAHPSGRPLCRRWRGRLSGSCDKTLGLSKDVPFPQLELGLEIIRAPCKLTRPNGAS